MKKGADRQMHLKEFRYMRGVYSEPRIPSRFLSASGTRWRLIPELRLRALGGEPALQVPNGKKISMVHLPRDLATDLSDSSFANNSCLFSLISRCTLSSISRSFSSSLRSCSSLRRTLWVASSSGRIDESL